ncbi:hypothetical protein [Streptomyces sp. NBC_01217]|uniref:hypothetical protein n=1 Tax=Streptomyces sp. NBC_01217 TaxID=2903779 RepID=UPI002E15B2C6|nr:hypothetical protein OG507_36685 [Streptomyces sp. NBC_01217]
MESIRLTEYARMPRACGRLHLFNSTVDVYGRVHRLLTGRAPERGRGPVDPYDAVVVTADHGKLYETHLGAVQLYRPALDALPDGGFVLADPRSEADEQHVQVFDALGRPSWTFRVGDAIEHLLADASGALWVGYFDEGVYGDGTLEHGRITETAVEPDGHRTPASRPDGGALRQNALVCRGSRIYLRERDDTDWWVFDLVA